MGVKDIEIGSIHGKVYNEIISLITEIACEKLFSTRTFRTSYKCYKCSMHVCDAFSRTKRVEMDVMGIEMS